MNAVIFYSALALILWSVFGRRVGLLALVIAAVLCLEVYRAYGPQRLHMQKIESNISTAFYTLHIETYRDSIPGTDVRGGGITLIGDQYLLATGDGRMYIFLWQKGDAAFSIRKLPYTVPANIEEFAADANPDGQHSGDSQRDHAYPATGY